MVALTGNPDGTSEVDYTVNPATGFPWATGPRNLAEPLNSVLPAWDVAMGTLAAVGLLAAERHRTRTGDGPAGAARRCPTSRSRWSATSAASPRRSSAAATSAKDGNYLYGAFGHDFETRDGRRVMVVALTARQWQALEDGDRHRRGVREHRAGHRLRPRHRDRPLRGARPHRRAPAAVVRRPRPGRRSASASPAPASPGGRTRRSASSSTRTRAARRPTRCSPRSSSPASARYLHARLAARLQPPSSASRCGALRCSASTPRRSSPSVLGLSPAEIGRLHDAGVVAGASQAALAGA